MQVCAVLLGQQPPASTLDKAFVGAAANGLLAVCSLLQSAIDKLIEKWARIGSAGSWVCGYFLPHAKCVVTFCTHQAIQQLTTQRLREVYDNRLNGLHDHAHNWWW